MEDKTFLTLSFAATILFALVALAGLLAAALVFQSKAAALLALLSAGAAYVSQSLATYTDTLPLPPERVYTAALALQALSCLLFVIGLFNL